MRDNDRRKLDHKTLEALRLRAVDQVQQGAAAAGATIYLADEAGIRSDHHAGTTCAPIGQT